MLWPRHVARALALRSADAAPCPAQARNDAKLRAVAQRVDYETFKNMVRRRGAQRVAATAALTPLCAAFAQVSVAHLRPLQAPNTRGDGA